jgi:photosystem II stability/assembly factor-like uncharacterized protein
MRLLIVLLLIAWQGPTAPQRTAQESGVAVRLRGVSAVSMQVAWASGADNTVLRTTDAGRSWQVVETPVQAGPSAGIFSIAFRDSQHGVVVGGDHAKEDQAIDNVAVTADGGVTWARPRGRGLSGFRSVVAHVPATNGTFIALGPRGGDVSTDDGQTWSPLAGAGADTFSAAPGTFTGWAAGAGGRIVRLTFGRME